MWPPASSDDIEAAIEAGILQERSAVDFKADLPTAVGRNVDVAIDVAAMATAGGTIIYGIAEDPHGAPVLAPISLAGKRERVANIVQSSLSEPPVLQIQELRLVEDQNRGYLVVHVPVSPLAPHMVQVKGDFRYYGRNEAGNYRLPHSDVLALLDRRRRLESSWTDLLAEVTRGHDAAEALRAGWVPIVVAFAPVIAEDGLLPRARPNPSSRMFQDVLDASNALVFERGSGGHLRLASVISHGPTRTVDGWRVYNEVEVGMTVALEVGDGGRVCFSHPQAAWRYKSDYQPNERLTARDHAIAQVVAHTALFAGRLFRDAAYTGPVDGAIWITHANGVVSERAHQSMAGPSGWPFAPPDYQRGGRWLAAQLADEPRSIASALVRDWLYAIRQVDDIQSLLRPPQP